MLLCKIYSKITKFLNSFKLFFLDFYKDPFCEKTKRKQHNDQIYENWLISMGTKEMQYRSQQKGILCPLCQQSIGIMMMSWVEKDVDQWEFTYTLLQAIQFITYTVWEIHYKQTHTHMYSSARVSMAELCIITKKKKETKFTRKKY